jgi:hypothetical protein
MDETVETPDVYGEAVRFVAAAKAIEQAPSGPGALLDAICERDLAFHELTVAVGFRCDCEPGTCPGAPLERVDVETGDRL